MEATIRDYRQRIGALSVTEREMLALKIGKHLASNTGVERMSDQGGLVAYVVLETGKSATLSELRNHLSTRVPEYMLPSAFIVLDALPLTAGGKVDRRALPFLQGSHRRPEVKYAPPRTTLEALVAEIWREVLHLERVGLYDNFFDLGGHSLLMIQVHSRLRGKLQSDLTMIDMFKYPSVSTLARFLGDEASVPDASSQTTEDRVQSSHESARRQRKIRREFRAGKIQ